MSLIINYSKKSKRAVSIVSYFLLAVAAAIFQYQRPHWTFDVLQNAFRPGYGASALPADLMPEEVIEMGAIASTYKKNTPFYLSKDLSAAPLIFERVVEYIYPYRISCDYQYGLEHGCGFSLHAQPRPITGSTYLVFSNPEEIMAGCDLVKNGIKVRLYECKNQ